MRERETTLQEVVERLGARIVSPIGSPDRLDTPVVGVELYEASDMLSHSPGFLLLLTSSSLLDRTQLREVCERAASAGFAGIALKGPSDRVPELAELSRSAGMPILRIAQDVRWQLFEAHVDHLLGGPPGQTPVGDPDIEPIFAVANELAEYFGGSVAVEDLSRNIIAFSSVPGQVIDSLRTSGILSRRVPDSPFNDDQYRTVLSSRLPVKWPRMGDEEPRVACAIRAGALPLGTIWAIDATGEREITPEQSERMLASAGVVASYLLDNLRIREANQRPREERLRRLLTGADLLGTEFAELGFGESQEIVLVVIDHRSPDRSGAVATQLTSLVSRHLRAYAPESVAMKHGSRVYALMPASSSGMERLLSPLVPLADRLVGGDCLFAVTYGVRRANQVVAQRELGDRMIEAVLDDGAAGQPSGPGPRIYTPERLQPLLLARRLAELFESEPELGMVEVDEMLRSEQGEVLGSTLLAWLRHFGNVASTARDLGVHQNTVRHRLERATSGFRLPLQASDDMLAVWCQLVARGVARRS